PPAFTHASPFGPRVILYGTSSVSFLVIGSSKRRPMRRFTAKIVLSGLVTAWRFAGWPIRRSPSFVKATTEGVVRAPSLFSITFGLPPSMTATQLLVVPKSIPRTLAMPFPSLMPLVDCPLRQPLWLNFEGDIGGVQATTRHSGQSAGLLISFPFPVQAASVESLATGMWL